MKNNEQSVRKMRFNNAKTKYGCIGVNSELQNIIQRCKNRMHVGAAMGDAKQ